MVTYFIRVPCLREILKSKYIIKKEEGKRANINVHEALIFQPCYKLEEDWKTLFYRICNSQSSSAVTHARESTARGREKYRDKCMGMAAR